MFFNLTVVICSDLRPENIVFTADGTLKLIDFGCCAHIKPYSSSDDENTTFPIPGAFNSNRRYMAPERLRKERYNERCDVYSFGILLWQMARDRVPYDNMSKGEIVARVGGATSLRPKLHKYWTPAFCCLLTDCWNHVIHLRPSFAEISSRLHIMLRDL